MLSAVRVPHHLLLPEQWLTDPVSIACATTLVDKAYIQAFAGKLSD